MIIMKKLGIGKVDRKEDYGINRNGSVFL